MSGAVRLNPVQVPRPEEPEIGLVVILRGEAVRKLARSGDGLALLQTKRGLTVYLDRQAVEAAALTLGLQLARTEGRS